MKNMVSKVCFEIFQWGHGIGEQCICAIDEARTQNTHNCRSQFEYMKIPCPVSLVLCTTFFLLLVVVGFAPARQVLYHSQPQFCTLLNNFIIKFSKYGGQIVITKVLPAQDHGDSRVWGVGAACPRQ
jgi:hypothetical protein